MRRCTATLLVLVLCGCDGIREPLDPGGQPAVPTFRDLAPQLTSRRSIVMLAAGSDPGAVASEHGLRPDFVYTNVFKGFSAPISESARVGLVRDPRIVAIGEEKDFSIDGGGAAAASWGLDRVDQRTQQLDGTYNYTSTGKGVTAYIVDTGIRFTHHEFGGRAIPGFDAFGEGGTDCNGHGSHVSGTVGGSTYGVARDVGLVAVRVLNCWGAGTTSTIIAGLDWVAAHAVRPAVVNMSLGGGADAFVDAAVQAIINAGVPVAVAAGNAGMNACDYSPARLPDAMTVGATTATDQRAGWSNWGTCIDWFAPGDGITSAGISGDDAVAVLSGTSMASPHTAGAAALYLEKHPSATPAEVAAGLAAVTTKGVVSSSFSASSDLLYTLDDGTDGSGGNKPPVPDFSFSCSSATCQFKDASTDPDGNVVGWQWDFGDHTGALDQNPSHTWAASGTWQVSLIVRDDKGVTSWVSKPVTVGPAAANQPPTAAFSVTCTALSCDFSDKSSDSDGSIARWVWDFGDGGTSVLQSATGIRHDFPAGGRYSVKLSVTDNGGSTATTSQDVTVGIVVTAVGSKQKGKHVLDIGWVGAVSPKVDIFVNSVLIATKPNTGSYSYSTENRGQALYIVRVCEMGTTTCSLNETVTF